jgi:hypothetical protein
MFYLLLNGLTCQAVYRSTNPILKSQQHVRTLIFGKLFKGGFGLMAKFGLVQSWVTVVVY